MKGMIKNGFSKMVTFNEKYRETALLSRSDQLYLKIPNYIIENALDIDQNFLEENNFDDKLIFYEQNFLKYY